MIALRPRPAPVSARFTRILAATNRKSASNRWIDMAWKVRMCLEEKRVDWTSKYIDLFRFDQMEPDYLKFNPDGRSAHARS